MIESRMASRTPIKPTRASASSGPPIAPRLSIAPQTHTRGHRPRPAQRPRAERCEQGRASPETPTRPPAAPPPATRHRPPRSAPRAQRSWCTRQQPPNGVEQDHLPVLHQPAAPHRRQHPRHPRSHQARPRARPAYSSTDSAIEQWAPRDQDQRTDSPPRSPGHPASATAARRLGGDGPLRAHRQILPTTRSTHRRWRARLKTIGRQECRFGLQAAARRPSRSWSRPRLLVVDRSTI